MFKKIVLGFVLSYSSMAYAGNTELKYADALEKAQKEKKPLVVLIGAKWCPGCVAMKRETIEPMKKDDSFKEVVFVAVDVDDEPDLVQELYIVDEKTKTRIRNIPQIMIFSMKKEDEKKYGLIGKQSKNRVLELLKKLLNK